MDEFRRKLFAFPRFSAYSRSLSPKCESAKLSTAWPILFNIRSIYSSFTEAVGVTVVKGGRLEPLAHRLANWVHTAGVSAVGVRRIHVAAARRACHVRRTFRIDELQRFP